MAQNTYLGAHWCSRRQWHGFLSSGCSFVNAPPRRFPPPWSAEGIGRHAGTKCGAPRCSHRTATHAPRRPPSPNVAVQSPRVPHAGAFYIQGIRVTWVSRSSVTSACACTARIATNIEAAGAVGRTNGIARHPNRKFGILHYTAVKAPRTLDMLPGVAMVKRATQQPLYSSVSTAHVR
jgi:hypothetical protein